MLDAIGEAEHAHRIAYGMPDVFGTERARYAGKVVAVLGAGHSAVGTILDLGRLKQAEPQTQIVWLLRGDNPEKSFGGGANDKLAARGELGKVFAELVQAGGVRVEAGFRLTHISANGEKLRLGAGSNCCGRQVEVDELIVATGFRPDLSFLRELRISLDPALECPPDPGATDRSQSAQLRHGAPAWRTRTGATRGRLLLRRHEVLRTRADVPDDDRLRAGALDRCRHRR